MDNINNKIIGKRINAALALNNMKQKELAEKLGVKSNVVSYWCSGNRTPNAEQIIKISKLLKVSSDYLLGLSNVATSDKDLQFICDYLGLSEGTVKMLVEFKEFVLIPTDKDLTSYYASFKYPLGIEGIINNAKKALDDFLTSQEFKQIITRISMLITLNDAVDNIEYITNNYNNFEEISKNDIGFDLQKEITSGFAYEIFKDNLYSTIEHYDKEQKFNFYSIIDIIQEYSKKYLLNKDINNEDLKIYNFFRKEFDNDNT